MFTSRITGPRAAALLVLALAVAGGCETDHTTPEPNRNPPPPPQRMPRAVEMSTGAGSLLLSNEISEEEAEKLKQGATSGDEEATDATPQDAAPEDGATK